MIDYNIEIIDYAVFIYLEDGVTLRIQANIHRGLNIDWTINKSEWQPVPNIIHRYKDTIPGGEEVGIVHRVENNKNIIDFDALGIPDKMIAWAKQMSVTEFQEYLRRIIIHQNDRCGMATWELGIMVVALDKVDGK